MSLSLYKLWNSWDAVAESYPYAKPDYSHSRESVLLIHPQIVEIDLWQKQGWSVSVVVYSDDLFEQVSEKNVAVARQNFWEFEGAEGAVFSQKYDRIVSSQILSYTSDPVALVEQYQKLLKPENQSNKKSQLELWAKNALCYQNLIDKMTREYMPWPIHAPRGRELSLAQWHKVLKTNTPLQILEVMDELSKNPDSARWQVITGPDCAVNLPPLPIERKNYFVKFYGFVFGNLAEKSTLVSTNNTQSTHLPLALKSLQEQIESALEKGDAIGSLPLLQQWKVQNGETAAWFNWQGVVSFYQKDHVNAYVNFIEAIERDQNNEDYWLNLKDVAEILGRLNDVQELARFYKKGN